MEKLGKIDFSTITTSQKQVKFLSDIRPVIAGVAAQLDFSPNMLERVKDTSCEFAYSMSRIKSPNNRGIDFTARCFIYSACVELGVDREKLAQVAQKLGGNEREFSLLHRRVKTIQATLGMPDPMPLFERHSDSLGLSETEGAKVRKLLRLVPQHQPLFICRNPGIVISAAITIAKGRPASLAVLPRGAREALGVPTRETLLRNTSLLAAISAA